MVTMSTIISKEIDAETDPGQTKEVGVAVGAALGAVDLIEMLQRELEFGRQRLSP